MRRVYVAARIGRKWKFPSSPVEFCKTRVANSRVEWQKWKVGVASGKWEVVATTTTHLPLATFTPTLTT